MAIKLGELLVREGLVSEENLEDALRYQVLYGGRLGTNLIEMGLVDEDDIARVLSEKLGLPHVPPSKLQNLSRSLLDTIPVEIAERFTVLPVARKNKTIFLAMADPTNLHAIDEIAFRTGHVIKPVLTPEFRLRLALEQHYGIVRKERHGIEREMPYVPLDRRVIKARSEMQKDQAASQRIQFRQPDEEEEFIEIPGIDIPEGGEGPETTEEPVQLEPADIIEEIAEADIIEEPYTLDTISRLLADAGEREDIADILIGYLGQEFDRAALFQVRGATARGWRGMVNGTHSEDFSQLEIDLEEPSMLKTAVDNRNWHLGAISLNETNARIFQRLGGGLAPTGLVVPIQILGRVVGLLYADGEDIDLARRAVDLQKLAAKASMAFEILILKKKILML